MVTNPQATRSAAASTASPFPNFGTTRAESTRVRGPLVPSRPHGHRSGLYPTGGADAEIRQLNGPSSMPRSDSTTTSTTSTLHKIDDVPHPTSAEGLGPVVRRRRGTLGVDRRRRAGARCVGASFASSIWTRRVVPKHELRPTVVVSNERAISCPVGLSCQRRSM
jgi:hypothetical protein